MASLPACLSPGTSCRPCVILRKAVRISQSKKHTRCVQTTQGTIHHAGAVAISNDGTDSAAPQPSTRVACSSGCPKLTRLNSRVLPVMGVVFAVSALAIFVPNAALAASDSGSSSIIGSLLSFVLHLDKHLSALIQQYGNATYALLWAIVFCETGLVVTPFLPGDSLLFATGAFAGMGMLNLPILLAVLMSAAILGDAVNYAIGNKLGAWMTKRSMVNPRYIKQTEEFYNEYGGKTIVLARFLPIVRTFAPFVAGVGKMNYSRFALYNVVGALIWTLGFCGAGFFFGNLPAVQHNFSLVVLGIIVVSCLPVLWELYQASKGGDKEGEQGKSTSTA